MAKGRSSNPDNVKMPLDPPLVLSYNFAAPFYGHQYKIVSKLTTQIIGIKKLCIIIFLCLSTGVTVTVTEDFRGHSMVQCLNKKCEGPSTYRFFTAIRWLPGYRRLILREGKYSECLSWEWSNTFFQNNIEKFVMTNSQKKFYH